MPKRKLRAKSSKSEPTPLPTPLPPPKSPGDVIRGMILGDKSGEDALIAAISGLAKKIPCSPDIIDAIIFFDHEITPTMAQRLEKHLGLKAADWLEMEKKYKDHLRWLDSEGHSSGPPF